MLESLTPITVGLVLIASALGQIAGWYACSRQNADRLTFEEVCRAAADAKLQRRTDENLTRDFTDGADAVMAELLDRGYGDTPEEMRAAYRAGGEEPELEVHKP